MEPIRHLFVLSLLSACSLGISGPAPDRPRREVPKCDSGKGLVAADGVFAAGLGLAGIAAGAEGNGEVGGALALVGTAFLLSAVHGNTKANACREELVKFALETPPRLDDDDDERERIARQARGRFPRPAAFQPPRRLPPSPPAQPRRRPMTEQVGVAESSPVGPPPAAPIAKEPPAKPAPRPAQQTDDWHDFWQEVP